MNTQFWFIDLYIYPNSSTTLTWLLMKIWNREVKVLQLCSSFATLFSLFWAPWSFYFFLSNGLLVFFKLLFYKLTPSLYLIPTNFRLWHTALFLELRMVVWHIVWTQPILILELMRVAKESRNKPKTFTTEFLFLSSQALWGKNHKLGFFISALGTQSSSISAW